MHIKAVKYPKTLKMFILILFLFLAIKLFSALGADMAAEKFLHNLVQNESIVGGILGLKLASPLSSALICPILRCCRNLCGG